jgi:hypothetical protein
MTPEERRVSGLRRGTQGKKAFFTLMLGTHKGLFINKARFVAQRILLILHGVFCLLLLKVIHWIFSFFDLGRPSVPRIFFLFKRPFIRLYLSKG